MKQLEMQPVRETVEEWSTGAIPDLSGLRRFTIMIRALDDPERLPRGEQVIRWPHLTMKGTRDEYRAAIREHLADGKARTWNRICVEMFGITADIAPDPLEEAMWSLVYDSELEHTMVAPTLIRRRGPL